MKTRLVQTHATISTSTLFWEQFKITLQKITQYKHTHLSVWVLCFSDRKTVRSVLPYSKLLLNGCKVEKMFNMTKFRIFDSYPTVYYLPYFDKLFFKNRVQNQIWPYSNSFLKCMELEKHFYTKELCILHSFRTPYHLRQSDKPFAKNSEKTFCPEFHRFSNYF